MTPTCDIRQGNCLDLLRVMPANSFDSCITDPPYEYGFMGKAWDSTGIAFSVDLWKEHYRVLKPGAFLLAFGGTRSYHRMICAIEDAGFEIRDQIGWLYATGFPKSKNLKGSNEGLGTALKPAWEPIVVARKPIEETVEKNFDLHGTGVLNIEASRVPHNELLRAGAGATFDTLHHHEGRKGEASAKKFYTNNGSTNFAAKPGPRGGDIKGRWPANIIHDGSAVVESIFPLSAGQQGDLKGHSKDRKSVVAFGDMKAARDAKARGDTGSAARFFYCAKPSRFERDKDCDSLPDVRGGFNSNTSGQHLTRRDGGRPGAVKNNHATVKPVTLMRYLVRLATPQGGKILDSFAGSGTTGVAALEEGFSIVLIENDLKSFEIAMARTNITPGLGL